MKAGEFSPDVKAAIKAREGNACGSCGQNVESLGWVHQHRRARGMGGSKDGLTGSVVNGVLQCVPCNLDTEAHPSVALVLGYRVPQGKDPARVADPDPRPGLGTTDCARWLRGR